VWHPGTTIPEKKQRERTLPFHIAKVNNFSRDGSQSTKQQYNLFKTHTLMTMAQIDTRWMDGWIDGGPVSFYTRRPAGVAPPSPRHQQPPSPTLSIFGFHHIAVCLSLSFNIERNYGSVSACEMSIIISVHYY